MAVAHHVAQLRVVAGAKDGRQLVGPPGRLANGAERLVALLAVQLLFHLRERRPDDVVMVDVRSDGLRRIEPDAVDEIEIAGRERRRVRAEMIGVGPSAAVMDDEPDVERFGLGGLLPGVAEQSRLFVRRERGRLADVHVGRAQAQNRRDDGVEDVVRRDDEQAHRAIVPLGEGRDLREHSPLGRRGSRVAEAVGADVDAEQPYRHDDDIAIARRLERGGDMSERMRIANGHEHVARTNVHLVERELGRRQDIECVGLVSDRRRHALAADAREEQEEAAHQRDRRDGRHVAGDDHRRGAKADEQDRSPEAPTESRECRYAG